MRAIIIFAILLGSLTGCGSKSRSPKRPAVATQQGPPSQPVVVAVPNEAVVTTDEPRRETPNEADLQPPVESSSVIDLVEEGRLYRRALENYERGEMTLVEEARDQLIHDDLYQPLGQALEALVLSRDGEHDQAMRLAEELSTAEMMQTESFVIAGEVFRQRRQLADAIACLRNAVQRNPAHAVAHRLLGSIHLETGAMVLAAEHFRAAANADSKDGQSLIQSGQIHFAFDGFESAVEDFRRALHRDLDQVTEVAVRMQLAEALLALDRPKEALETTEPCDAIAPVLAIRGQCHLALGRIDDATKLANEALAKAPIDRRALLLRSKLYMDELHFAEATPLLERLVTNDSQDLQAAKLLLECLTRTEDPDRARTLEQRLHDIQEFEQHVEDLKLKAVDQPQDAQLRVQVAEAYERQGRIPAAIHWYDAALGLDPALESIRDKLDRLRNPLLPPLESLPQESAPSERSDDESA